MSVPQLPRRFQASQWIGCNRIAQPSADTVASVPGRFSLHGVLDSSLRGPPILPAQSRRSRIKRDEFRAEKVHDSWKLSRKPGTLHSVGRGAGQLLRFLIRLTSD